MAECLNPRTEMTVAQRHSTLLKESQKKHITLTLSWCADGSDLVKSTKKSARPVLAAINQLPYHLK